MSATPRVGPESGQAATWAQRVAARVEEFELGERSHKLTEYVLDHFDHDMPAAVAFLTVDPDNHADVYRQAARHDLAQQDAVRLDSDSIEATELQQADRQLRERFDIWRAQEAVLPVESDGGGLAALARTEAVAAQDVAAKSPTLVDDQSAAAAMAASTAATAASARSRGGPPSAVLAAAHLSQVARQATTTRLHDVIEMVENTTSSATSIASGAPRHADRHDYPRQSPSTEQPTLDLGR